MAKKRKWGPGIAFLFSIVLFSISLFSLMGMFFQKLETEQLQAELVEIYQEPGMEPLPVESDPAANRPDAPETEVSPGLLALHESNPDCIGWLTIEGTVINYPVMYRPEEKDYYLRRDFYGNYSVAGSLFLSEACDPQKSDNLIIYGHHMADGTMFGSLEKYKDAGFYEKHPEIIFDTLNGTARYEVIAVFCTPVYTGKDFAYYAFTSAGSPEEFDTFLREVMSRSLFDTGRRAAYGDQLLSLSTCEYSQANGRLVVVAKKINESGNGGFEVEE